MALNGPDDLLVLQMYIRENTHKLEKERMDIVSKLESKALTHLLVNRE
jgi:hypothetical protein